MSAPGEFSSPSKILLLWMKEGGREEHGFSGNISLLRIYTGMFQIASCHVAYLVAFVWLH